MRDPLFRAAFERRQAEHEEAIRKVRSLGRCDCGRQLRSDSGGLCWGAGGSLIEDELGARARPFKNVREILFWIGEEMDRRMSPRSAALELASPRSEREIAEGIATLAAIIWHLHSAKRAVDPRCWRRIFAWQLAWNQPDEGIAKEWGFRNFNEMRREMYRTEGTLHDIFTKRGLLEVT